jgi:DNA-binding NarL/FixJ family response regulator
VTRLLIIGSLAGELGQAARLATARGASLIQVEGVTAAIEQLRGRGADLILADAAHDLPWLLARLTEERIATPLVVCGRNADAEAVLRAIRAGAREFLPLPPEAELIAAMLEAVTAASDGPVCQDPAMRAVLARARRSPAPRPRCSSPGRAAPARRCWRGTSTRPRSAPRAFRGAQRRGPAGKPAGKRAVRP